MFDWSCTVVWQHLGHTNRKSNQQSYYNHHLVDIMINLQQSECVKSCKAYRTNESVCPRCRIAELRMESSLIGQMCSFGRVDAEIDPASASNVKSRCTRLS